MFNPNLLRKILPQTAHGTRRRAEDSQYPFPDNMADADASIFDAGGGSWKLVVKAGKAKHEVEVSTSETIADLKTKLHALTQVPPAMQKLMFKGKLNDGDKIGDTKLKDGAKLMMVGNTMSDIIAATAAPTAAAAGAAQVEADFGKTEAPREPLCTQEPHKKYISAGPPEGAEPGLSDGTHAPLPAAGLQRILGHTGKPCRLTLKPEIGQLWIASAERTQKLMYGHIRKVLLEEPIEGHPGYCIMSLQIVSWVIFAADCCASFSLT